MQMSRFNKMLNYSEAIFVQVYKTSFKNFVLSDKTKFDISIFYNINPTSNYHLLFILTKFVQIE